MSFNSYLLPMIFGVKHKAAAYTPFIDLQHAFNRGIEAATCLVVLGYSWSDDYINMRIRREWDDVPDPRALFVVDIGRDAVKMANEPNRCANVFIGGGAGAALNDEEVEVGVRTRKGTAVTTAKGGLVGALRVLPTLLRDNRPIFPASGTYSDDYLIDTTELLAKKLLRESYSGRVVERDMDQAVFGTARCGPVNISRFLVG